MLQVCAATATDLGPGRQPHGRQDAPVQRASHLEAGLAEAAAHAVVKAAAANAAQQALQRAVAYKAADQWKSAL